MTDASTVDPTCVDRDRPHPRLGFICNESNSASQTIDLDIGDTVPIHPCEQDSSTTRPRPVQSNAATRGAAEADHGRPTDQRCRVLEKYGVYL